MSAISSELREWVRPGLAGMVTVVRPDGLPEIARVWGARSAADPDGLEIDVQRAAAVGLLAALDAESRAAVNLIEIPSYRSRTFKGSCRLLPVPPDVALVEGNVQAVQAAFQSVGMPADATERMLSYGGGLNLVTLLITVDSVFDQSPKPGAGARL